MGKIIERLRLREQGKSYRACLIAELERREREAAMEEQRRQQERARLGRVVWRYNDGAEGPL